MLLDLSSKSNCLLKLLFLLVTIYGVYAVVEKTEAREHILNLYKNIDNGQTTPGKLIQNMEKNKNLNIKNNQNLKEKNKNLNLINNQKLKINKNSKQISKEIKKNKKLEKILNEGKKKKQIELKTKELISKEIKKQNKKEKKEKEIKEEMAAIEAVVIKNLTKDLEKVKKEVKKTRKEIEKEIEENERENNKNNKKHKHHKNAKNKEMINSDEDDDNDFVIPTFGEHPGFMAIIMHKLIKPKETKNNFDNKSKGKASKENSKYLTFQLKEKKDVHNLLWTALAVAQEKLLKEKDKGKQTCLLEFIARMVGGAYSPFAFIQQDTHHHHHITSFIYKLRKNDIAFLSSGYRKFWREKIGEEKFNELEKKVKPVFINKEY